MPPSTPARRACCLLGQGRLADAEPWLERAGRTVRTEAEPAAAMNLYYASLVLAMARGRHQKALADIQAAERLAGTLVTPPTTAALMRAHMLQTHMGWARPNVSKPG